MHAIRKLSVTEHPRPFENTVFPKTNTWKRMWGYFKAWAFKTYSIQAFIDHAFYLRYLRYLVIGQKQNFLGADGNSHPKRFSESSIVPSFLFGEAEKWKFPSRNLGERTRQVWRDNSRRVRTHEKNSGDAVRWLGTKIQRFFFVPNQEPASVWIFGNGPVRVGTQGVFRPYLKIFVAPFLPARLTAPGSPRMMMFRLACSTFKWSLTELDSRIAFIFSDFHCFSQLFKRYLEYWLTTILAVWSSMKWLFLCKPHLQLHFQCVITSLFVC